MSIEDRLRRVVSEELGINEDEITRDATFADDLSADSLDRVSLVMAAEEEFGLAITDVDAEELVTFGKLVDFVSKAVARQKGAA